MGSRAIISGSIVEDNPGRRRRSRRDRARIYVLLCMALSWLHILGAWREALGLHQAAIVGVNELALAAAYLLISRVHQDVDPPDDEGVPPDPPDPPGGESVPFSEYELAELACMDEGNPNCQGY